MRIIKHYRFGLIFAFALLLGGFVGVQPALAWNPDSDDYVISTVEELEHFRNAVNDGEDFSGKTITLENNIDLSEKYGADKGVNGAAVSWTPIGNGVMNNAKPFNGTFNGGDYTISGLYIYSDALNGIEGLFGTLGGSGTVKNLTVSGEVTAGDWVGGVVGYNEGTVENCHNEVAITVTENVRPGAWAGGIVGENRGTVQDYSNNGKVAATTDLMMGAGVGDVVGDNSGTIENCCNNDTVTVTAKTTFYLTSGTGGIVGYNYYGTVYKCRNEAAVKAEGDDANVGGVVGGNNIQKYSINSCINKGSVAAKGDRADVGGVVGSSEARVENCINDGAVHVEGTSSNAGGVVGYNDTGGGARNCISKGNVTIEGDDANVGGVAGENEAFVVNCYYLEVDGLSGIGYDIGYDEGYKNEAIAKTKEEFATGEIAWLLQNALNAERVWGQNLGTDLYPALCAFDQNAPAVYRVDFDYGKVSEETTVPVYTNGAVKAPPDPEERTGYTFGGWYNNSACEGSQWDYENNVVEKDTTLYAKWTANTYKVTLNVGGGTINGDVVTSYTYGVGATLPTDVSRNGYKFGGWYEEDFSGEPVTTIGADATGDKTYYAKWLSADTGVSSVTVKETPATLSGTAFTVTLPAGSSLPTDGSEIDIIPADGAQVTAGPITSDYGATWTFTVTAESGASADYTIHVSIQVLPTYTVSVSASPVEGGTAASTVTSGSEGTSVTVTATPASGYHFAGWTENGVTVSSTASYTFTLAANRTLVAVFEQNQRPIPDATPDPSPSGPSTGESDGWASIANEITDANDGDTIIIDMNGETEVPEEIFEAVAGRDVNLVFEMGDDLSWTVNGSDIPAETTFRDLDLGVDLGTDGIPVDVINAITGEITSVQMTLAYDGDFGFTMTLTAPLGVENAGYWANLYYFDEDAKQLTFETAAEIDADGSVSLPMSHASQYAIVIDDHSHATIDLPFSDVSDSDWFYDPVVWIYNEGLMTGTSATMFEPNTSTTRAMIVSMLARLEDVTSADRAGFTDVAADDWYATAVNWAASEGIVGGFGDGTFQPNAPITREQMASILYRYAEYKGYDVSARADLSAYSDQPSV